MDNKTLKSLQQALTDLQAERRVVDEAISTLQSLLGNRGQPRGRATPARASTSGRQRRKPKWNRAMREAARERMRKYWEQRRKGKG